MTARRPWYLVLAILIVCGLVGSAGAAKLKMGLLLVGPYNDHGWSQAHYEAAKYLEEKSGTIELVYIDKVNPADRPGVTIPQLVDDLVGKGCGLVIANSDDMKDGIVEAAEEHPGVKFVHVSGDQVLAGKAPANLTNVMGKMVYGKMMAGFVAALTSRTGKIAYLGPLINEETRRLASACYLGARYAWTEVLKRPAAELSFKVTWIGFWFNIPGVTADPTQVTQNFFNSGYDVVASGIDTTEALVVAEQKRKEGKTVWAIPYDYRGACGGAGETCLGVPYFNWVPAYRHVIQQVQEGAWKSEWRWLDPNWQKLNDVETSPVGFETGPGLSAEARAQLDRFVAGLASGKVNLYKGPLQYQDGSVFVPAGATASEKDVWYTKQLLQGMEGQSSAQ
jgi:simple sugar transport system substrate-binding protein